MPWTKTDYPDSFKNLDERVRNKAIEIANTLVEDQNYSDSKAIAIATTQAKQWAARRNILLGEEAKAAEVHVVPSGERWGLRDGDDERSFSSQAEAISAARQLANSANTDVVIHAPDGKIRDRISLRKLTGGPTYHVSPREQEWIVIEENADRASRVFEHKADAVEAGREIAQHKHGTLVIHAQDDSIQRIHGYSATPTRR